MPQLGKTVLQFSSIPSTHDLLIKYVSNSKPDEGLVIMADFQSEGRGQLYRKWHSPTGENILFSLLLYPTHQVQKLFALQAAFTNAIRQLVAEQLQTEAYIKWPNDIYVDNKKIAGILMQSSLKQSSINWIVISAGINVNQTSFSGDFPATSFKLQADKVWNRNLLFNELLKIFSSCYLNFQPEVEITRFSTHLLGYQELKQFVHAENGDFEAIIEGVDAHGRILLNVDDEVRVFSNFDCRQKI